MKWFKHISDSLDDPFIFDLMENFGHSGYVVFFGTLEIYAREFEPVEDWFLSISLKLLRNKLQFAQATRLKAVLKYIESRGKWNVKFEGKKVNIQIPKFLNFLDESTLKKLRQKRESNRNHSGIVPESFLPIDTDADADVDIHDHDRPAGRHPPGDPSQKLSGGGNQSRHYSKRVGTFLEKVESACNAIASYEQPEGVSPFNPFEAVTWATNQNGNPEAITETISYMADSEHWSEIENPWGWFKSVFSQKNAHLNEKLEIEDSKAFKKSEMENSTAFKRLWDRVIQCLGPGLLPGESPHPVG
jgi:hypothetical protein